MPFFSLPAACRLFSRGVIFTPGRVSLALLSLRKNGGLTRRSIWSSFVWLVRIIQLQTNMCLQKYIYYIHTEKYSPKSYVVNFRTQISSSQSVERTMVFTREKSDTSNQNRERRFFTCEKNDTSNQKPQRCVSFAPKFPPFIAACSAASHTFNEKSFFSISR